MSKVVVEIFCENLYTLRIDRIYITCYNKDNKKKGVTDQCKMNHLKCKQNKCKGVSPKYN